MDMLKNITNNSKKCSNISPLPLKFFSQFTTSEIISLNNNLPDIDQIVSIIVEPQIISCKIINTMKGCSCEGQKLTGKKVAIELVLNEKILYAANMPEQSLHIIENKFYQSAYIVIPPKIEGTNIESLYYNKKLKPFINIEPVSGRKLNNRCIHKSINLFIYMKYIPTYELCYTIHNNCSYSNIYAAYEDGSNPCKLTFNNSTKIIKPQWSPCGNFIAFLQNDCDNYMLYIVNIRNRLIKKINVPDNIKYITSFSWAPDSRKIIFSALAVINSTNVKELFCVDINTFHCKQLTDGKGVTKSYKPMCSPNGENIAFLHSSNERVYLCVKDFHDGMNFNQLTFSGDVKDFDWSEKSNCIVYLCSPNTDSYKICNINLDTLKSEDLFTCKYIGTKKKVRFSPDNKFIAYIGSNYTTEDIFLYDMQNKTTTNLTNNDYNTKISDFVWKIDSTKIYFSQNTYGYYNIFSISLNNKVKDKLNANIASNIELSYRSKVI